MFQESLIIHETCFKTSLEIWNVDADIRVVDICAAAASVYFTLE